MDRHLPFFISLATKEGNVMPCLRLETDRLLLRPPEEADVGNITALIGDWDIVKNLATAPYPYLEEHAREFIARMVEERAKGAAYPFAITRKDDGVYVGQIGLHLKNGEFEIGYWLGKAYWQQGYATEAARRTISFAFRDLKATKLIAGWFHDNPASGHVLEKLGFTPDGAEPRDCKARGHAVYCHMVRLDRENFGKRAA
jgi:RimJ/RimL family protein N-acetyltransferase